MTAKPKAFSYVRMSTLAQLSGDSLRRQTKLSEQYADEHGLELVRDFTLTDVGVSAFRSANSVTGALAAFLSAIKQGQVPPGSFLLVESLDRLSRDKAPAAMSQFLQITQAGINVVTLSDGTVYPAQKTDFIQLITSLVVMQRANEESETKSQRVGAAWQQKRMNAGTKKLTKKAPAWLTHDDRTDSFSLLSPRDQIVKDMFEKSAAGWGSNAITRDLNQREVPVFGVGNGWHESYVTKILSNRAVLGEFQSHRMSGGKRVPEGQPNPGYYPRVIDDELFYRVQNARASRKVGSSGRKGSNFSNLFTNIATCETCGSPMHFINKGTGPRGGSYLRCSSAIRKNGCNASAWRYSDFEMSFLLFTKEVDLGSVLTAANERAAGKQLADAISSAEGKISYLKVEQERVYEANLLGELAIFARKLGELEAQITSVQTDLNELQQQLRSTVSVVPTDEETRAQIKALQDTSGEAAFDLRLRLATKLKSLIVNLTLSHDGDNPLTKMSELLLSDELRVAGVDPNIPRPGGWTAMISEIQNDLGARFGSHPTFQVEFADGTVRRVFVDRSAPDQLKMAPMINRATGVVDIFSGFDQAPEQSTDKICQTIGGKASSA